MSETNYCDTCDATPKQLHYRDSHGGPLGMCKSCANSHDKMTNHYEETGCGKWDGTGSKCGYHGNKAKRHESHAAGQQWN